MLKNILFIILIFAYGIKSDFINDNYEDLMKCFYTETDKCSSTKLKTQNLECCKFVLKNLDSSSNDKDEDDFDIDMTLCDAVFTSYVSQNMVKQIESIAIEHYGILKAYADIDIPRIKEDITCTSTKASYEFGGYDYTSADISKLKSKNHCLYYYFNSIGENFFSDTSISITKDKCINAESLDVTKNSNIYCAYADAAILYSDGTKNEFKTCYFLPSESINSKKLDPTTEAALAQIAQNEAQKSGKTIKEYDVEMVDKNGRTIKYNSVEGIVETSNPGKYLYNNLYKFVLFSLILLF